MILHIAPDEKFIDRAYSTFEEIAPNQNHFIITSNKKSFTYIKKTKATLMPYTTILQSSFIKELATYDFVVLHWLDEWKMKLVLKASKKVKFLWIGWGGDYYNYIVTDRKELFLDKTRELFIKNNFEDKSFLILLKKLYKKILFSNLNIQKVMQRIDFFAPVLYTEYAMLQNKFQNFKPQFIDWNYGELQDNLVGLKVVKEKGNILLGNSATFENNHIEAIDKLSLFSLEDKSVIVPLSYGNIKYAEYITGYLEMKIKSNTKVLRDFMDIDKYNTILSSCSFVIMNHLRQQALSNIIAMLYNGAKVFLNPKNPAYTFFKEKGMIIFSIDELTQEHMQSYLNIEDVIHNKEVLQSYLSREIMLKKTAHLITTIRCT